MEREPVRYFIAFLLIAYFLIGCSEGMKPLQQKKPLLQGSSGTTTSGTTTGGTTGGSTGATGTTTGLPPDPNPNHVQPGARSEERVDLIAEATFNEFQALAQPTATIEEKQNNTEELLRRTIWHLQLAGYQSGRQKNPSGAISRDKLSVQLENGAWMAYDLYTDWDVPERITRRVFVPVGEGNYVPDSGVPD
jgi:hypothetical protein